MPQQELFSYVNEACPECKAGELVLTGEYSKYIGMRRIDVKLFKCNKCKFIDKRLS